MSPRKQTNRIILHHAAFNFEGYSPMAVRQTIELWHLNRGFSDIGYHFIIHPNCEGFDPIIRGRDVRLMGAHCRGHNRDSIGICVARNYEETPHVGVEALIPLKKLIKSLITVYGHLELTDHRSLAATFCPGPDLRQKVRKHIERG